MSNRVKVMLDTNVWRYLIDADSVMALSRACIASGVQIVVAPALVDEVRAFKDDMLRKRILKAISWQRWSRLMPDIYLECLEVLSEIRRCRPEWCIHAPKLTEFNRLKYDWGRRSGGFWDRAGRDDEVRVTDESLRSDTELRLARAQYKANRSSVMNYSRQGEHTRLQDVYHEPPQGTPGWNGDPIEYWRMPSLHLFLNELMIFASPVREWMDCQVNFAAMLATPQSVNRLWLHDMQSIAVPRQWLRGSFEFLQMWRTITPGSPIDSRLSVHLVDVDVVVSADKNFVYAANRCCEQAPFKTARASLISGGPEGVKELLAVIEGGMTVT
jgi:hypothetical protein